MSSEAQPAPSAHRAASGAQVEIRYGDQAVTVTEVGAGLRTYAIFALISIFFVRRYLRETKGKTLEQM